MPSDPTVPPSDTGAASDTPVTQKFESLADALGLTDPVQPLAPRLENITDSKLFAQAVLASAEFRFYIIDGLFGQNLPPAVLCRLMDYGWGKPPERLEHTGADGKPIEVVTTVRRIVVHAERRVVDEATDEQQAPSVH